VRAAAGLALLILLGSGVARAEGEAAEQLEALRRAIEEHRERVGRFEREERSLLETLEEMDRAVEALERDARRARSEAEGARRRLGQLALESEDLERRHGATRQALASRAVALYKAGEAGPLRLLFAAESLPGLLRRTEVLRLLVARDLELVERFRSEAQRIAAARAEAERTSELRDGAAARFVQRSSDLERERAARQLLMQGVRRSRTRVRAALYELEAAAQTLEETLLHLGETPLRRGPARPEVPFASLRGHLEPPVEGSVAGGFGRVVDQEFSTRTFRKGVEFLAEEGTPVQAVAGGEVRFAGWFRGYGKLVILDHGDDYFTVSAHLREVRVDVGDPVRVGQVVGTVGDTGSLSGPRLYFEIRRGGEPQDPDEWLRPMMVH
jgi:septal ring factor EnvC (AmiA/AmiB activator)